jgi:anthranilate synthase/aminodeoxychorismate synthase-like glutamine amidotransferase
MRVNGVRAADEPLTVPVVVGGAQRVVKDEPRYAAESVLLIIDNYDSFTWNLQQAFASWHTRVTVVRNDRIGLEEIAVLEPAGIVLSPGPGTPDDSGICRDIIRLMSPRVPILGVCLGHQVLCVESGATLIRARVPVHGKSTLVRHDGEGLFRGVESPMTAGRYHSLVIEPSSMPHSLEVVATTEGGEVMAVRHRRFPRFGIQFHPESILTPGGDALLRNFLRIVQG